MILVGCRASSFLYSGYGANVPKILENPTKSFFQSNAVKNSNSGTRVLACCALARVSALIHAKADRTGASSTSCLVVSISSPFEKQVSVQSPLCRSTINQVSRHSNSCLPFGFIQNSICCCKWRPKSRGSELKLIQDSCHRTLLRQRNRDSSRQAA